MLRGRVLADAHAQSRATEISRELRAFSRDFLVTWVGTGQLNITGAGVGFVHRRA